MKFDSADPHRPSCLANDLASALVPDRGLPITKTGLLQTATAVVGSLMSVSLSMLSGPAWP